MHNTLSTIISSISNDYYIDYYLPNYKPSEGVNLSQRKVYIANTLNKYSSHHKEFQKERLKPIIEYFEKIILEDKIISFKNTLIYQELYKMIWLIDITFQAQTLLNNSQKYPCGFAELQSDIKEVKIFHKHNKRNIVGKFRLHKSLRGQSRFRTWLTTIYMSNKTLAKFFTHLFLTSDLQRVKDFHETDDKTRELILEELNFILMQRTSISKVIKSLGILLYWEMRKFLKLNKDDAEIFTKAIIYELFKENFNIEELEKVIEIKSSLGYLPVFGASKKASLQNSEKKFIHKKIFKEINKDKTMTKEEFNPLFESYIKTPHIQFLQKYPVELFRLNPKYSPIN